MITTFPIFPNATNRSSHLVIHKQTNACMLICASKLICALSYASKLICVLVCAPKHVCSLVCAHWLICVLVSALVCAPKLICALLCSTKNYNFDIRQMGAVGLRPYQQGANQRPHAKGRLVLAEPISCHNKGDVHILPQQRECGHCAAPPE